MSEPRKDSEWLQSVLVELLTDAKDQEKPEHSACAKYAELLFKMLPKGSAKEPDSTIVERARALARKEREKPDG